ncbi:MAG: hypothetical protein CVU79_10415 [Elusimicrobia bacterium HGW-Elusimicrobia-3]|nr:MAG: hypothetical protein CVU79_10415 [Elusimicrobia bacterium HGW-Elusimicrobia-3]
MRKSNLLALALAPLLLAACSKKAPVQAVPEMARLETFAYAPGAGFESRIGPMPERLLEIYREIDGRTDYRNYAPTAADKALVLEYLRLMPPALERVFREKCVGLYFVENLQGNGVTSWVVDREGTLYFHMTLNPAALRLGLSETLTERESSCFIPEKGRNVSIDSGGKHKGLAYALFHEGAHAADYIYGLTPLVDEGLPEAYRPPARPDGGLFTETWESYSKPFPRSDFPFREKLTFYGFGGGPKIPLADADGVYAGLAGSPFVSLYGAKSWAEDFAELTAYGLITGRLGQPYRITVTGPLGVKKTAEPLKNPAVARRAAAALALLEKL